jgi:DNA-binding PadR family transcriptional regulator
MEDRGLVVSTWDEQETQGPPRRVYRLTALGDEALALWVTDLEEAQKRINYVIESYRQHMQEDQEEHHYQQTGEK